MPIANCIITPEWQVRASRSTDLMELWANQSSEHMTVNIVTGHQQYGKQYSVMANLLLLSLYLRADISLLQLGLAKALALYYKLALSDITGSNKFS